MIKEVIALVACMVLSAQGMAFCFLCSPRGYQYRVETALPFKDSPIRLLNSMTPSNFSVRISGDGVNSEGRE